MTTTTTLYRLIVDTNAYAGNFERESVAFATGLVGECGVGGEEAEQAREEMSSASIQWWEKHGLHLPDDEEYPCLRPAAIYPTVGFFNNGYGGHFPSTDEGRAQALVKYKEAVVSYEGKTQKRLSEVEVGKGNWTQEALDREMLASKNKVAAALLEEKVNEHPAYQSVAVCTDELPPPEVVKEFSDRMKQFLVSKKIELLDISMETETTTVQPEVRKSVRTKM